AKSTWRGDVHARRTLEERAVADSELRMVEGVDELRVKAYGDSLGHACPLGNGKVEVPAVWVANTAPAEGLVVKGWVSERRRNGSRIRKHNDAAVCRRMTALLEVAGANRNQAHGYTIGRRGAKLRGARRAVIHEVRQAGTNRVDARDRPAAKYALGGPASEVAGALAERQVVVHEQVEGVPPVVDRRSVAAVVVVSIRNHARALLSDAEVVQRVRKRVVHIEGDAVVAARTQRD